MKQQVLILLFIVLVTAIYIKEAPVFSNSIDGELKQQANTVETFLVDENGKDRSESISSELKKSEENLSPEAVSSPTVLQEPVVVESFPDLTTDEQLSCQSVGANIFMAQRTNEAEPLFEKNIDNRWPIASITKLMTAVVALENLNLSDVVEISEEVMKKVEGYNSFGVGEKYSVSDLIKASLVFSSNDASYALAYKVGYEDFIRKMNEKAVEFLMTQTVFYEPSGLSYLNQSTAQDLFSLSKNIADKYPLIFEMTRQKSVSLKERSSGKFKKFNNINLFAGGKDFFGGKTGFIDQSGGNLITLIRKDGKIIVVTVLGSQDRFGDTDKIISCIK